MGFGGGFATGIAVGIGSGMAMGSSSGNEKTRSQIQDYVEQNGITIQDRYGTPVKVYDLLDDACGPVATSCCSERKSAMIAAGFVLAIAVAAAVGIYFVSIL